MSAAISVPQFQEEHLSTTLSAEASRNPASHRPSIATARNLKKSYGNAGRSRHDLNLDIRAGELLALLGRTAQARPRWCACCLALARPDAGSVSVFGADPYDWADAIPRRSHAASRTRPRNAESSRAHRPVLVVLSQSSAAGRDTAIAGLADIKDRTYGELSGGQKQRVLFGIAICGNPDLLFLDEPTVGLDVEARRLMWAQIRTLIARGKTVLLTTHYLNEADALADRVLVLNKGSIDRRRDASRDQGTRHGQADPLHQPADAGRSSADSGSAERERRSQCLRAAGECRRAGRPRVVAARRWLADLEVINAGLEEAFLALTKKHNADRRRRTNMATTTFPAALVAPRRSLTTNAGRLCQRSKVRAAEEHPHPGLCDLHRRVPADVLCAVRHRAGT